jgi:hypothetical protein
MCNKKKRSPKQIDFKPTVKCTHEHLARKSLAQGWIRFHVSKCLGGNNFLPGEGPWITDGLGLFNHELSSGPRQDSQHAAMQPPFGLFGLYLDH